MPRREPSRGMRVRRIFGGRRCGSRGAFFGWRSRGEPPSKVAARSISGLLHGQGDVGVPSNATRPWFDVAPLARFRWELAEHWFVEASAALAVPLRRETFIFDPRTVFFEVPWAGPAAAVGIGYAFGDRSNQSRP